MAGASILIIEDEAHIAEGLRQNLQGEGYQVQVVANGAHGLHAALRDAPDLVVLDVMLPAKDGFAVCSEARAQGFAAPILFLSARASPEERVRGLKLGGDDYLGKPFHLAEFLGRVEALLRRAQAGAGRAAEPPWVIGPLGVVIDVAAGEVRYASGHQEEVPPREFAVLRCLWQADGEVVSREALLEEAYGHDVLPSSRALEACINRWRSRIEPDPAAPTLLVTERGIGYRLLRPPA